MSAVSGLYAWSDPGGAPFTREELRLDVDGFYPQMAASGSGVAGLTVGAHWVAKPLTALGGNRWSGPIAYKAGDAHLLPHTQVALELTGKKLRATFAGQGLPSVVRVYNFKRRAFRQVALEFDAEQEVAPVLAYRTHEHPGRPAALANERLSVRAVFERAGFRVTRTGADGTVSGAGAGAGASWSNSEMHDAMQVHFSLFREEPVWGLWTFIAGMHEDGFPLGGVMFDQIGPQQRQGTAVFMRSFISQPPHGDPAPDAWRRRMAFWTTVHEMGHAFNLLHAWEKHLGDPWIAQPSGYDQRSFMNYPYYYGSGEHGNRNANSERFFRDFEFRFTDEELLFLRHAPERHVIMGGELFGEHHALEQAAVSPAPALALEVRTNRGQDAFEFLEPVVLELKLKNQSPKPIRLPDALLKMTEGMTVLVQQRGGPQRTWHPYAHYCRRPQLIALQAGQSLYESLFLSAGARRWLIDEPGYYQIRVCLHLHGEDIVSNTLVLRVTPPRTWDEEYLAQDYFSDDVARVLNFDGSRQLATANDTLRELVARLPERKAAVHAQVALAMPQLRSYKLLTAKRAPDDRGRYRLRKDAPHERMGGELAKVLAGTPKRSVAAAVALGHIDYREYALSCAAALDKVGEARRAQQLRRALLQTLRARKVLARVLTDIEQTLNLERGNHGEKVRGTG